MAADTAMMMPAAVKKALTSFGQQLRCPICLESVTVPYSLPCNHIFCEPCIGVALTYAPKCPVCKAPAKKRHLRLDESIQRIQNALQGLLAGVAVKGDDDDDTVATRRQSDSCAAKSHERSAPSLHQFQNHATQPSRAETTSIRPPIPPIVTPLRLQPTPIKGDLPRYKGRILQRRLSQKENEPTNMSEVPPQADNPACPSDDPVTPTKALQPVRSPSSKADLHSRTYSDSIVPCTQESCSTLLDLTSSIDATTRLSTDESKNAARPTSNPSQPAPFKPGDVVQVMARTWPGINKLGGTAWISTFNPEDYTYNVRYVLGGRENRVHSKYISIFQDLADEAMPVRGTKRRVSSPHAPTSPFSSPGCDDEDERVHFDHPHNAPSRKKTKKRTDDRRAPDLVRRTLDEPMVLLCSGLSHEDKLAVEECASHVLHATIAHEWVPQVTHIIVQCQHLSASKLKLMMPPSPSVPAATTAVSKPIKRWAKIRSLKFLKALVSGRWIVGPAWIKDCLQQRKHVDEEVYEVHGLVKSHHVLDVAKKARLLRESFMAVRGGESASSIGTGLFSRFICYVHGQFASPLPPKAEICALIRLGSGKVSTSWTEVEAMAAKDPSLPIVVVMEHATDAASFVHPATSSVTASSSIACVGYDWVLDCISECRIRPAVPR
ncbi:hypothetical protein H310_13091 [Aphanomyces invadans]|uniref:RING-type E3 ubiquitin transferase BRCA1 n=1 Tax=Aphanomyces invadans TaxID=157072 RepID=A0A024TGC6_9STRA|nr:hypothetical protein H310_13091 [Aphanomyces invadans]ETV92646.1 hypothetical protein H310_13091 [Aphanomyces invadans]|eukprot:XP_008878682.1 hypothetical protein H310_13091 [Aphanomyces invadans]